MSADTQTAGDSSGDAKLPPQISVPPDFLSELPEDKRAELLQIYREVSIVDIFSGPLPPPAVLNQYDSDARQTIVDEAVENRRHRIRSEERGQRHFIARDMIALIMVFVLALVLIVGSLLTINAGRSVEGLLGIGGTVSVIAGAFLYRDHRKRNDDSDT